jgi:hypothetical protein
MRLSLGTNAADAHARLLRKEAELNAVNNGVMVVKEAKDGMRSLAGAVAEYLADVKLMHKPRSFAGARASTSHSFSLQFMALSTSY